MSEKPIDYEEVLRDLEARRAELDVAIAAIKRLVVSARATPETPVSAPGSSGPYADMSIGEAAKLYLFSIGKPQTSRQITDALRAGGIRSMAKNLDVAVYSALRRQHDLKRVRNKWTLKRESVVEGKEEKALAKGAAPSFASAA